MTTQPTAKYPAICISRHRLKQALLAVSPSVQSIDIEDINMSVQSMIGWADMDADGLIDFEEYKRIITIGWYASYPCHLFSSK